MLKDRFKNKKDCFIVMYLVLDTLSKRIFAKASSFKKALKEKEKAALKYNTNPNSI